MQRVDRLAVHRTADVDLGVVRVSERLARLGEIREALAQAIHLGLDHLVVGRREVQLDFERVVAREVDDRPHLDDGVELDVAVLLARSDLDLGAAMASMSSATTASA